MSSKKFYETPEDLQDPKYKKSCWRPREALAECIVNSECIRQGFTAKQCLQKTDGAEPYYPDECDGFRVAYFKCKRSMFDMRYRFRGRQAE